MSLSSLFQRLGRRPSAGPAATLSAAEIEGVRQQAKRRLIGMTVLVVVAVLLLSWLLETEPRQAPRDIRIEVAASAGSEAVVAQVVAPAPEPVPRPVLADSAQRSAVSVSSTSAAPLQASLAEDEQVVTVRPKAVDTKPDVTPPDAVKPVPAPVKPQAVQVAPEKPPAAKPTEKTAVQAPAAKTRYVVQIGAFSDVTLAREARLKVEKLGFKTYTQVINTAKGRTIRVRVGPYTDEAEARHAVASIRLAGMTAGLLTL
jgi:DedD protein